MPRREGMLRKDLLKANAMIFKLQGTALEKVAKKTVKVRFHAPFLRRWHVPPVPCMHLAFANDAKGRT